MGYNTDKKFWEKKHPDCNCGSFAFDLNKWYCPGSLTGIDSEDELIDLIDYYYLNGYDEMSIANQLLEEYIERIITDFEDKVYGFSLDNIDISKLEPDEELIAFRAGVAVDEIDAAPEFDYDFHFKVFRKHEWYEKNGSSAVHHCEIDNWYTSTIFYNSDTIYFIHKRPQNLT